MQLKQKVKLDYIWLDGYETKNIRNKTKYMDLDIIEVDSEGKPSLKKPETVLRLIPEWSFDGSSTKQADGECSDLVLRPVRIVRNPIEQYKINSFIVLCEVVNPDGTPHESNSRYNLIRTISETNQKHMMFGIEQDYTLMKRKGTPLGRTDNQKKQGKY